MEKSGFLETHQLDRVGIISVFCLVMFGHKFGISCSLTGFSLKGIPELHTQSNNTEAKKQFRLAELIMLQCLFVLCLLSIFAPCGLEIFVE